jgi:hypothetical protein
MKRRYDLQFSPTERLAWIDGKEIRTTPSAHDVPRSFTVSFEDEQLEIDFEYLGGKHEQPVLSGGPSRGAVSVHVGRFSGRLLQLRVDVARLTREASASDLAHARLLSAVRKVIDALPSQEGTGQGANYAYARNGLGLDGDVPPPWVIDALGALRPSATPRR